jgi:hypothetical protein
MVTANGDALKALTAYNCDPRRDADRLDRVKDALHRKAVDAEFTPRQQDEARRCIEAIELFERHENALGMRGLPLHECPRLDALSITGVAVSIKPHFLVRGDAGRIGAGIVRVAKAPDPAACRLDATRERRGEHRREMGRYMAAMLYMLLEAQNGALGVPDRDLCFVADVRLGERLDAAPDHALRVRAIRGACAQITRHWPLIQPRNSVLHRGG